MIHDEICTYEVCKLAKEKGFNEKVYNYYQATKYYWETLRGIELHSTCWKLETDDCYTCYNNGSEDIVSAPTQSLLQRWLREEKGIHISIDYQQGVDEDYPSYDYSVYRWPINTDAFVSEEWKDGYSTYEFALEDALKYALENLV